MMMMMMPLLLYLVHDCDVFGYRLHYKNNYETFKLRMTWISMALTFCNLLIFKNRWERYRNLDVSNWYNMPLRFTKKCWHWKASNACSTGWMTGGGNTEIERKTREWRCLRFLVHFSALTIQENSAFTYFLGCKMNGKRFYIHDQIRKNHFILSFAKVCFASPKIFDINFRRISFTIERYGGYIHCYVLSKLSIR